ncbi:glycoside hydrolase family 32 protein [Dongshaea marina]|uniref:glycoside hydrolase family 32 protein n=1 Tax=Dongshaea marina TaxID=2047966 RepID=UPI000D3E7ABF|nr:sucrose-6-phosphate hydrolase [Dongshaea marina]
MRNRDVTYQQRLQSALTSHILRGVRDPWRPAWHLSAPIGYLYPPGGFCYYQGRYQLFYQWDPFSQEEGRCCWGHINSPDLLRWYVQPPPLLPGEIYDRDGCTSGSVIAKGGDLHLIYTGNVNLPQGLKISHQCMAIRDHRHVWNKQGLVVELPEGYGAQMRDPKVWLHLGKYYLLLGAQTQERQGQVLLYRSGDLKGWELLGAIAGCGMGVPSDFGYMWESPELFELEEQHFLLCCPHGICGQGTGDQAYVDARAGYFCGDFDYEQAQYTHGSFHELDWGFDFYAPQTCEDEQGRRLMLGWLANPLEESHDHPSCQAGWAHCMSMVRELVAKGDKLYQRPLVEYQKLRDEQKSWQGQAQPGDHFWVEQAEIQLSPQGRFFLEIRGQLRIHYQEGRLVLERKHWLDERWQTRSWLGDVERLELFFDHSTLEIFINQGEAVMSSRFYARENPAELIVQQGTPGLSYWPLKSFSIF